MSQEHSWSKDAVYSDSKSRSKSSIDMSKSSKSVFSYASSRKSRVTSNTNPIRYTSTLEHTAIIKEFFCPDSFFNSHVSQAVCKKPARGSSNTSTVSRARSKSSAKPKSAHSSNNTQYSSACETGNSSLLPKRWRFKSAPPYRAKVFRRYVRPSLTKAWRRPSKSVADFRRTSLRKSKAKQSETFGEIEFLRNKLGFLLPTVEETLKSMQYSSSRHKAIISLQESAHRLASRLLQARRIYYRSPKSSKTNLECKSESVQKLKDEVIAQHKSSRKSKWNLLPLYAEKPVSFKSYGLLKRSPRGTRTLFKSTSTVELERRRCRTEIDKFVKHLQPVHQTRTEDSRALLRRVDGSVRIYTKEEIDSFYQVDENTLKLVKDRVNKDRQRAAAIISARREASLLNFSDYHSKTTNSLKDGLSSTGRRVSMDTLSSGKMSTRNDIMERHRGLEKKLLNVEAAKHIK